MILDYFKLAIKNIRSRKMRSWLTMLGIFVGIVTIVSLLALGFGLQKSIDDQFKQLGSNKIYVMPKGIFGPPTAESAVSFTTKDIKIIKDVAGVDNVAGFLMRSVKIEVDDSVYYRPIYGVPDGEDGKFFRELMINYGISQGRDLKDGDKYKVVAGIDISQKKTLGRSMKVNDKLTINGVEFTVVGFWGRFGNPEDDSSLAMPENTLREITGIEDRVSMAYLSVNDGADIKTVGENIQKELRKARGVEKGQEEFEVETPDKILDSFTDILLIVQVMLVGIAGISLVVGGVGIMNTMYTAVLERTNEIGVMKSIGAKNSTIMLIFLVESGTLGLVGGIIGVIIGVSLAKVVEWIGINVLNTNLIMAVFPPYLIIGVLVFSFLLGSLSGLLPARQASKQHPVDSLRYE